MKKKCLIDYIKELKKKNLTKTKPINARATYKFYHYKVTLLILYSNEFNKNDLNYVM